LTAQVKEKFTGKGKGGCQSPRTARSYSVCVSVVLECISPPISKASTSFNPRIKSSRREEQHNAVKAVVQNPNLIRVAAFLYRIRTRIATAAAVVLAVFLGYHVIAGRNGITAYEQKRTEDKELQKQIQQLQDENARMKEHVDHLQNDPDAIEHEARARLHYTRPGEVIYTLNDKPADKTSTPPAK
jgi:cell division protein FtsB